MAKKGVAREVAEEYCAKFPRHADRTIASKLMKEHPLLFKDLEHARSTVRIARGHHGNKNRKATPDKALFKPVTKDSNPYKLPESYADERLPFILPKADNNILMISDLHVPYHDISAINAAIKYGQEEGVNTIFINGDLIDFHGISRFQKDPRKRSVKQEFDAAKEVLRAIRAAFPNASIYWALGNHDERYEHWLMAKAPEIFDDEYYSMEERLRLNEEKVKMIDGKTICRAGKLAIAHGHHIMRGGFGSPVNAARSVFTKAKASMIVGHTHSVSEHTETDIHGDITTCFSTGCLCELKPDYSPQANKYAHGFAHIMVRDNGYFSVRNYRIHKGELL